MKTMFLSPLVISFSLFFIVHVVGLAWTTDTERGLDTVLRLLPFSLFGFLWLAAKLEKKEIYINSFVFGLAACAVLAHYNLFHQMYPDLLMEGITTGKRQGNETAPFLSHIMYSPLLACGIFFLSWSLINIKSSLNFFLVKFFVLILLLSNLMFSTGRAGFLMLIILISSLIVFKSRNIKIAFLKIIIIIPFCILIAYNVSDSVQSRVNAGIGDVTSFSENPNSSVGGRIVFAIQTFDMYKQNMLVGVGTGDLLIEYPKYVKEEFNEVVNPYNPHNQYLMVAATTGSIGLFFLLAIFYLGFKHSNSQGRAIIFGYIMICLVESYLWRSNTGLAFIYFVAIFTQRQSFLFSSTIK